MIRSFFKITIRNFWKHKVFSFINITGLTIGLVCSVLLYLYVKDEMSYDKFHSNYENIYRIKAQGVFQGKELEVVQTGASVGQVFIEEVPEVIKSARLITATDNGNITVKRDDRVFSESRVFYADSCFFEVFTFPLLHGDPLTALDNPGTVVLTQNTAQRYFGKDNPIGELIQINSREYKVTGISKDCPSNSHFHFDILISYTSHWVSRQTTWINNDFTYTYLVLEDGTPASVISKKIAPLVEKYLGPELENAFGASFEEILAAGNSFEMTLQPIADIHLNSHTDFEIETNSNKIYLYFFSLIAVFILVLAGINFMNLSTARSAIRAKEVGLRKVVGSSRKLLVFQFLFEAILYSVLSLIIAMIIVEAILPYFNNLTMKQISIQYAKNPMIIVHLIVLALALGIFSGIYSAIHLSSIKVLNILKGKILSSGKTKYFRNGLVIFQFVISIVLFTSTLIIRNQLEYIREKDLGYDRENMIIVKKAWELRNNKEAFKNELLAYNNINNISYTESMLGKQLSGLPMFLPDKNDQILNPRILGLEYDFINTFKIKMLKGEFFTGRPTDTLSAVINESLAKEMGFEDPIGKLVGSQGYGIDEPLRIIGVSKNFAFQSLHKEVGSLLMVHNSWRGKAYIAIRINNNGVSKTIKEIEETWEKFVPNEAIEYYFLDDDFLNLHKEEFITGKLFTLFSILSIIIACLGLFGLSTFMAEQKTKEIGIRKSHGASFRNIIMLLIKDFSRPILFATLIAWPLAYFLMGKWLQKFAFHVDIRPYEFIIATILALLISWLTIIFQAIKSAKQNPVDSLRYE